jgi:L-ascorbate metabolism protein UlaG (beta-lactamase superfamily)
MGAGLAVRARQRGGRALAVQGALPILRANRQEESTRHAHHLVRPLRLPAGVRLHRPDDRPLPERQPELHGDAQAAAKGCTAVALTHGHADHVGDTVAISLANDAPVATNFELGSWLGRKGLKAFQPMNTGGQVDLGDCHVALTGAFHSSSGTDEMGEVVAFQSLGMPNGVVVTPKDRSQPTVWHMGDTDIFSDMALIAELYDPQVVMIRSATASPWAGAWPPRP